MSDGQVVYDIVGNTDTLDAGINSAEQKLSSQAAKWSAIGTAAVAALVTAAGAGAAASIEFGQAFEQSLANASTLIDTNITDMDALSERILSLSDSSGVAATELNTALYSALSAGVPATEDMSEALAILDRSSQLAKAGFTDMDTALSATMKTLNAYGLETTESDRIQKILMQTQNKGITTVGALGASLSQVTPTAAAMGVSFEQVGASLATMTAQGTATAQATTQLNGLIAELGKSGTTAANNFAAAAEGTEYAGMSFQQLMAAGVPLNDVLNVMGDYAASNDKSLLDMFSSIEAGKSALALAGDNSSTFTENLAAMSTEADVVGEAFDKVTSTSSERFAKALNQLKNIMVTLYNNAIQPLVIGLADLLSWMADNREIITVLAIAVTALVIAITAYSISLKLAAAGMTLASVAGAAFGAVMAFVTSPITLIILAIGALIAIIYILIKHWDTVKAVAENVWNAIADFFADVGNRISGFFSGIWGGIKDFLLSIWNSLDDENKAWLLSIYTSICNIFTAIGEFFAVVWDGIKATAVAVWESIKIAAELYWNSLRAFFAAIWEGIQQVFGGASEGMAAAWQSFISIFSGLWDSLKSIFNGIITFLRGVFTGNWQAAWDGIKQIVSGIWSAIMSVVNGFNGIGANIISGIWGGLQAGWSWLTGKVKNLATSLLTAAKSALGIASPSKAFRDDFSKNIVAGASEGIDDNAPVAIASAKEMAAEMLEAAEITAAVGIDTSGAEATLGALVGLSASVTATGAPIVIYSRLDGTVEVDGYTLARMVLQNIDDAAAYTLRG